MRNIYMCSIRALVIASPTSFTEFRIVSQIMWVCLLPSFRKKICPKSPFPHRPRSILASINHGSCSVFVIFFLSNLLYRCDIIVSKGSSWYIESISDMRTYRFDRRPIWYCLQATTLDGTVCTWNIVSLLGVCKTQPVLDELL